MHADCGIPHKRDPIANEGMCVGGRQRITRTYFPTAQLSPTLSV